VLCCKQETAESNRANRLNAGKLFPAARTQKAAVPSGQGRGLAKVLRR